MHTEGVVPGEALAREQLELEEERRGCKVEETLDQFLAELGMHMMAVDSLLSSAEAPFDGRGTARAVVHQEPGIQEVPLGYNLQAHSGDCKVAYSVLSWKHNLRTSRDWNHLRVGTGCHRMKAAVAVASVFDTEVFVAAAVVVRWPPVVQSVSAADKPGIQPSAAA